MSLQGKTLLEINGYTIYPSGKIVPDLENYPNNTVKLHSSKDKGVRVYLHDDTLEYGCDSKNNRCYLLHALVGRYFLDNPNPAKYNVVKHKDGNKCNNDVSNLLWTNRSELSKLGYEKRKSNSKSESSGSESREEVEEQEAKRIAAEEKELKENVKVKKREVKQEEEKQDNRIARTVSRELQSQSCYMRRGSPPRRMALFQGSSCGRGSLWNMPGMRTGSESPRWRMVVDDEETELINQCAY